MKKLLLFSLLIVLFSCNQMTESQQNNQSTMSADSLVILWSTGEHDVFEKIIYPYAFNSVTQEWWDHVELLIWGPSTNVLKLNPEIQRKVTVLKNNNIKLTACLWCADQYKATTILDSLGIEVRYMGKSLSDYLKSDKKVITF